MAASWRIAQAARPVTERRTTRRWHAAEIRGQIEMDGTWHVSNNVPTPHAWH